MIRARVPRRVRVDITGILDLAHGRAAATDATAHVDATAAAIHEAEEEGGDKGDPAKPQEGVRGLCLTAVLAHAGRAVGDAIVDEVGVV